jgi:hypothetical protein
MGGALSGPGAPLEIPSNSVTMSHVCRTTFVCEGQVSYFMSDDQLMKTLFGDLPWQLSTAFRLANRSKAA